MGRGTRFAKSCDGRHDELVEVQVLVTETPAPVQQAIRKYSSVGKVVEITENGADDHINKLAKKYLGKDVYPFRQPGEERVIVKIEPVKVRHTNP